MKNSLLLQYFTRFVLIGIVNTCFGYGLWAFLIFLKLHYVLATILANIIGILFNFKTTGTFVFKNKNNKLLLKFILVYFFITSLSIVFLKIANIYGFNLYVAGMFLTVIMALIAFLLQKFYVFKEEKYEKN